MPIKHAHKSLAGINEKTFFYINFSSIFTKTKKQLSMPTFLLSLYLFWLTQVCILTMILTLSFLYKQHDRELVK